MHYFGYQNASLSLKNSANTKRSNGINKEQILTMVNEAMIDLISDTIKVNIKENKTPDKINHIVRKFLTIVNKKKEPSRPKDVFKTSINVYFLASETLCIGSKWKSQQPFLRSCKDVL